MSVVGTLLKAQEELETARNHSSDGGAAREFSLAITAIEDAIMRANRGFAKNVGVFKVADVEEGN